MDKLTFHYPPELFNLLVDTIPLLNRSKNDVLLFFKGAGVKNSLLLDIENTILTNRASINKYDMVRTILARLNESGENTLRERREVVKRVVEFESYESCWDTDRLKAKGLVYEVRQLINVKDSFTRMKNAKEEAELEIRKEYLKKAAEAQKLAQAKELFKNEISTLFVMKDPHKRGKLFEDVLNRLFSSFGILIKEAFTLTGDSNEGIIEQIDGVIELDGDYYLVEMKWWNQAVGPDEVAKHLVRVFTRGQARGIFFSVSGFTEGALTMCKQSLDKVVIVLGDLYEFITMLDNDGDLKRFLKDKIQAAIIDRNPYYKREY
ncbi:restriction endonuclease [Paenibacillus sp. FSL P4-0081]|uniref:restriction endonuclease n=1 Tax=Paenibacillus sp. FSL P4-0081 TaxID=1536769 RepID=UPI0004F80C34|nr:restriction endonuclease [Paenibacillus sp. FSL P4-0081]AIQ31446.1 restriction endonuclease [Paenibacillus sp. FSL P4-0081]